MAKRQRVPIAPTAPPNASAFERKVAEWLGYVERAINDLPAISVFSGNPNASGQTADGGTLGFDANSGSTQWLWVNNSGTSSSWSTIHYG